MSYHIPFMIFPSHPTAVRPGGLESVFDAGWSHNGGIPPIAPLFTVGVDLCPLPAGGLGEIDMTSQSRVPFPVSIPSIPNQQTQPWHQSVQPELRQHLVRKL